MAADFHVIADFKGGWSVRRPGATRAVRVFERQKDAVQFAREVAKKGRAELYIHGADGRIREKNSYRSDSFPPKG